MNRDYISITEINRYLNQNLYRSPQWLEVRDKVIIRDNGNDLGAEGYPINGKIIIHHINPITIEDVLEANPDIFNMDYLISCSLATHNAIHYGDKDQLLSGPVERKQGDTCPWKTI